MIRPAASVRSRRRAACAALIGVILLGGGASIAAAEPSTHTLTLERSAEVVATIRAQCDRCAWDVPGREAVVLVVSVDGRYSQHLPLARPGTADYRVMLGRLAPGTHQVRVEEAAAWTPAALRGTHRVERVTFDTVTEDAPDFRALAFAPFVYARPDTVPHFNDIPAFMWYEIEPTAAGQRYRYTVVFTNEDGGTPTDRLMATWGRSTDIEYVYSVEVDRSGKVLDEDMQGPEHETLPFRGRREADHPLLWVVTRNNMVLDKGHTEVRYAPAPVRVDLTGVSREQVMDDHPWLYELATRELQREDKIAPGAPPRENRIPDPRTFVYLEACGEVGTAALAFAVQTGNDWHASDRGVREYRIVRDGCFRAAIPVPPGTRASDIRAVRAQAYTRTVAKGTPPAPTPVRLTRLNRFFMLDEQHTPGANILRWTGSLTVPPDGPPVTIVSR